MSVKNILILSFIIFITIILFLWWKKQAEKSVLSTVAPSISPLRKSIPHGKIIEIYFQFQNLRIYAIEILPRYQVSLIPNFQKKEFVENIVQDYKCQFAINGGFYKLDYSPLGLFASGDKIYGKRIKSSIANGFFWQDKSNKLSFSTRLPDDFTTYNFIFQSGPFIAVTSKKLKLIRDEPARRSLIGIDVQNRLYILTVLNKDNIFEGPFLASLPLIFSNPEVQKQLPLTHLLNLDGGSASFFYARDATDEFMLSPLSPVGSVICFTQSLD